MRTNKQSKIAVPKSGFKRSKFNWSHDVNTTFSWGEIQPTQCKLLIPNSKTTMSTQSLIRLAPMVAPTFGRVKYKTYNQFVSLAEVFPNFDAMMAQEPKSTGYSTRTPLSLPYIRLSVLSSSILHGARATLYFADDATKASAGEYWTQYRLAPDVQPNGGDPTCSNWYNQLYKIRGSNNRPIYQTPVTDAFNNSGNRVMPNVNGLRINPSLFGSAYSNAFPAPSGYTYGIILGAQDWKDLCPVRRDYVVTDSTSSPLVEKDYQREVTFESADYVLEGSFTEGNDSTYFAFAFELSDFGKRLRKVLQGCGYQIDFTSPTNVSILPLLAQYKAYFDIFGLELYQGWETTYAAQLIKDIENRFIEDTTERFSYFGKNELASADNSNNGFVFLMTELANEWYTEDQDYVSAHLSQLQVTPKIDDSGFITVNGDPNLTTSLKFGVNLGDKANLAGDGSSTYSSQFNQQTLNPTNPNREVQIQDSAAAESIDFTNRVWHGQVDAELLKRMYKWCNRNTILGRRIADILRAQGLGKYVDECKSNYIGSTDTIITISDVVSTAATEDASLGEYGGKGLQYDASGTLVFENDSYGYWITLATVVPESGYTQGLDPTLTSLDKINLYNPDFDAIGMEQTPKENIVAARYICDGTPQDYSKLGFGFIPRYSKFKVANNLVNGDFNRHGKRNTYLPYTLDRQLNVNDFNLDAENYKFTGLSNKIWNYVKLSRSVKADMMPIAGNVWRCPTKYNWLGNFDRIFLRVGQRDDAEINVDNVQMSSMHNGEAIGFNDYNDDNFLGHHIYNLITYAPMKPIEDSYGLDDMDDPSGRAGVEFKAKA